MSDAMRQTQARRGRSKRIGRRKVREFVAHVTSRSRPATSASPTAVERRVSNIRRFETALPLGRTAL